jgi:hypothetical protein
MIIQEETVIEGRDRKRLKGSEYKEGVINLSSDTK